MVGSFVPLPYSYYGSTNYYGGVFATPTDIFFEIGSSYTHTKIYVYIEYTKTTDRATINID